MGRKLFGILYFCVFLMATSRALHAQQKVNYIYSPAEKLTLVGKAEPTANAFDRIDTLRYPDLSKANKQLLTNSAGIAISFKTNSTSISAKWCLNGTSQLNNLTPMMQKGLDLYIKRKGKWEFAGVGRPNGNCSQSTLVSNMDSSLKECLLYLPLYDGLRSLEIGVVEGANLQPGDQPFLRKIVIYGTSITQGASASRAGLAYPSILSRATGLNFINIGMSGSAKMDLPAEAMISGFNADAYILDCIPNVSAQNIRDRAYPFIMALRKQHPAVPIIVMESVVQEIEVFDQETDKSLKEQNKALVEVMTQLKKEKVPHLYFIKSTNLLGNDNEGTIDGSHPNDIGFFRITKGLKKPIVKILKQYGIVGNE